MKTGHDLSGLMRFAGRERWRGPLQEAMSDHVGPAMEQFDLEFEEIGGLLGDHWAGVLFGCAFEDLLTRNFEPGGLNIVDDYLKRRGSTETAAAKAYMRALKGSVVSLYEASDITPGQSFRARDLIRGGEPVLVSERSATRTLKVWDRIAARIMPQGEGHVLSGALLPFTHEAADALLAGLRKAEGSRSPRAKLAIDDDTLRQLAHLFTTAWLFDVLPKAMGQTTPVLYNGDGEEVLFHRVRFPLARGVTQADVAGVLDALAALRRETARFWNWLGESTPAPSLAGKEAGALAWNVTMEDGTAVLGNIELKGRTLVLSVNSAGRATRGTTMLREALGSRLGPPLTEVETLEQVRAAQAGNARPPSELAPEVATELVHGMLDKQYRATLDVPVGMLGNISPREAARTAAGRERLVVWLKHLENSSANRDDPTDPMATYDFGWMWRELGLEGFRR